MSIAIIPARGGSKRIQKKNVRDFFGKPIIFWSIEAAKRSNCFDRIIVSTDDEEIANISLKYGAEVPFIRPAELSNDYAETMPVIRHAIKSVRHDMPSNYICCIYATAPFITPEILKTGRKMIEELDCNFVFPVTNFEYPIQRALKISDNNKLAMFNPDTFKTRSQDHEEAYHDAGQFYWGKTNAWLEKDSIFENAAPIFLSRDQVQDIDTEEDWKIAEKMFEESNINEL
jgi:pseudaminic acid cytidylyltransferase